MRSEAAVAAAAPAASPVRQWPALRLLLGVVAAIDLASFVFVLADARAAALAAGTALDPFTALVSRPVVSALLAALGIIGALRFAARADRPLAGLVALLALAALSTAHAHAYGSPWRHLYYSGLGLAGWVLGLVVSRRRGAPGDESFARAGSLALIGAAYFNAGLSKLVFGGGEWLSGVTIQAIIVAQDGLAVESAMGGYRDLVLRTPPLVSLFSIATVLFELAGPLMLLGRWPRRVVAGGLLAMHLNIYLLTHILYWEPMLFLVAFGLSADPPAPPLPAAARAGRRRPVVVALAVVALALWAAAGIVHQGRRYAQRQAAHAAARQPPTPVSVRPTPALARLGPFALGDQVSDDWTVAALRVRGAGFIVALSGPAGAVGFEVTCAPSPHVSPFDLDAAHIFYSSALPVAAFEVAGRAVQARVREAGGDDVCAAVTQWHAAARAAQESDR